MAWRSGSFSRSFLNATRSPSIRPSTAFRRPPSPLLPNAARNSRRFSFTNPRNVEVLGCAQSLMPMHSVVVDTRLTSYIAVDARAFASCLKVLKLPSLVNKKRKRISVDGS